MRLKKGFISIGLVLMGAMLLAFGAFIATNYVKNSNTQATIMDSHTSAVFGTQKLDDEILKDDITEVPEGGVQELHVYTVNYYLQRLGAPHDEELMNYTLGDSRTGTAAPESVVSPAIKTFEGFIKPEKISVKISEDNLIINYFYERDSYRFTLSEVPGVSLEGSTPTGTYKYGETVTISAAVGDTYKWLNWKLSGGLNGEIEQQVTSFSMPASATTATPQITGKKYTVTYNGNGGTWNGAPTWSEKATYGEGYTVWHNFFSNSPGYNFAGWNTEQDGSGDSWSTYIDQTITWTYDHDITLYAQWGDEIYTVTYDGNGGVGSMSPELVRYGHPYVAQENFGYTRDGYIFSHWTEAPNGGVTWKGWIGKPWVWTYKKSITLYAQWLKLNTVTYDCNGGTTSTGMTYYDDPIQPYVGLEYLTLPNMCEREGYTFVSWNEAADGSSHGWGGWIGVPWKWTDYYNKDLTLYAIWKKNE